MPARCGVTVAKQAQAQAVAHFCGIKFAVAAIMQPRGLHNMAGIDQLFENTRQALLGNAEHFKKFSHRHTGFAIDEIKHTVMRTAKSDLLKDQIGVGGEVAIREEQQFNDVEIVSLQTRQRIADIVHVVRRIHIEAPSCCDKYVSIVDITQSPR